MKKKLAKYLADYLEHEIGEADEDGLVIYYQQILEQGLEAFESTEDVVISIQPDRMSTD